MYRDDVCAVCGESLPPDHLYCREHAAEVDDRLHEIGDVTRRLAEDVPRLARLLADIAPETWDWLAEVVAKDDELVWPPAPPMTLHVHADEVDVDVDTEPGRVRIDLGSDLRTVLESLAEALGHADLDTFADACRSATGAGATH
jgi:hypothetical protein